jgi:hypothetical protein
MCDASAGCTSGCTAPITTNDEDEDDDDDYDDFDDEDFLPEVYEPCDLGLKFDNLDDLNAAADGMRAKCLAAYTTTPRSMTATTTSSNIMLHLSKSWYLRC